MSISRLEIEREHWTTTKIIIISLQHLYRLDNERCKALMLNANLSTKNTRTTNAYAIYNQVIFCLFVSASRFADRFVWLHRAKECQKKANKKLFQNYVFYSFFSLWMCSMLIIVHSRVRNIVVYFFIFSKNKKLHKKRRKKDNV